MTDIIIQGIYGRMGRALVEKIGAREDCRIVAGVDREAGRIGEIPVYAGFDALPCKGVIIDFSSPAGAVAAAQYGAANGLPCVICSTGLSREDEAALEAASTRTPIFRSANMSVGVNVLIELARQATKILGSEFDIEIIEKHHHNKLDAPSGTALALADSMNQAMDGQYAYTCDRSTRREKRDPKEIGISSVRGGSIVGEHDVIFAGQDEVVTFQHTAYSKAIFAKGAVQGAQIPGRKSSGHVRHGRCDRLIHILLSFVHTKAERKEIFIWKRSDGSLLALCWLLLSVRPLPAEEMIPMEAPQDKAPDGRSLPRLLEAGPQRRCQGPRPQALTFPPAKAGQTERAAASCGIWWMM